MNDALTPFQREKLSKVFKQFDSNGDGTISLREFKIACRRFNPNMSASEVEMLAGQMDIDGNGMIDLEEFCLCMARHVAASRQRAQQQQSANKPALTSKQLRDAFNYFDKDKSGTISQTELRQVMQTLGVKCNDTEFKAMLVNIDTNGDGVIDFEEFSKLLTSFM
ncbi:neo-calmodulin-like [Bolinopsis microptera]|uniref:neo-calmodulin-like n=1 Tax=Bolinopsis microptera TaxID=2820187 RepID=UPI0030793281